MITWIFFFSLRVSAQQCALFDGDQISKEIARAYLQNHRVSYEDHTSFAVIQPGDASALNALAKIEMIREQRQVVFAWDYDQLHDTSDRKRKQLVIAWPSLFPLVAKLMSRGLNLSTYNALRATAYLPGASRWEFTGYIVDSKE